MERQFLCFLAGEDETALLAAIDGVDPGLVVLPGRYVDAKDGASLLAEPERHTFRPGLRSRRRILLGNRDCSREIVLHQQQEGPFCGLAAIDTFRSELFELELPAPAHGRLAPARLAAAVVGFDGYERIRKGAPFGRWVARVLRELEARYPLTAVDYVHLAPGAFAWAVGGGQLTWLEESVLPAPAGHRQVARERIRG